MPTSYGITPIVRGLCAPERKFGLIGRSWLKPTENRRVLLAAVNLSQIARTLVQGNIRKR